MPSNTLTLQNSINWASPLTGNRPLALQGGFEPALTSANIIIQAMLAPPFKWRWNRNQASFWMAQPSPNWVATKNFPLNYRLIDSNNNMQVVTTPGTSGGTIPTWNTTIGGTTADGSITWQTSYLSDYLVNIPDFGYIEKAQVTQGASYLGTPLTNIYEINNILQDVTQDFSGSGARPHTIAPVFDDNNGNITFRFLPGVPDQLYTSLVTYQKRMTLMTSLSSVWPIPDIYAYAYNTGFLGMIWLFADDARSAFMLQRFAAQVISLSDGLTEQEKNAFLDQWDVMVASQRARPKSTQGINSRGAI